MAAQINATVENPTNISSGKHARFEFPTHTNAITDDYELSDEALGEGINGKVLKCLHRITGRKCALKILKDSETARREVMMHKKACEKGQYIVQILDVYENMCKSKRCLLIIMECMEGGELFERIHQQKANPYIERDAARFISMIVQAVAHLHGMDMAHRDLKPENLLFTSRDNDAILKLTDFGFAKEANNDQKPLITPCYTGYYAPPEVFSGARYDKACDIWSMGVIMYILLCGYPPFYSENGDNMSPGMTKKITAGNYQFDGDNWEHVSQEAKETVRRMLTVNPAQRITINEILKCSWLTELTSERPIDVTPLCDEINLNQIQTELASANEVQRRSDDDVQLDIPGPDESRIGKRAAAKKLDAEKNQ